MNRLLWRIECRDRCFIQRNRKGERDREASEKDGNVPESANMWKYKTRGRSGDHLLAPSRKLQCVLCASGSYEPLDNDQESKFYLKFY